MNYAALERQGRIKPYKARLSEIEGLLRVAESDLSTAERLVDSSPDWAFTIAYNAALRAGRAFVFANGYRVRARESHATVVLFLREALPGLRSEVDRLDQMRRKRHALVYETPGLVSHQEALQACSFVKAFLSLLRGEIEIASRRVGGASGESGQGE